MNVEFELTEEQASIIAPLWQQATQAGEGRTLAGQVLQFHFPHPSAGKLRLQLVCIRRKTAEKMRAAYIKAEMPKQTKLTPTELAESQ